MVLRYYNFINESVISDLSPGTRVIFNTDITKYWMIFDANGDALEMNIKGRTAVVKEIKTIKKFLRETRSHIYFTLDEPFTPKDDKPIKEFHMVLSEDPYQFKNVDIIDAEFYKKISSGELARFNATKDLMNIFKGINFKPKEDYYDITLLDVVKDNSNVISFIPSNRSKGDAWRNVNIEKYRQQGKVGRVLKKLNSDLSDKNLEDFVNKYKAEQESYFKAPEIDVVTGKGISHWYLKKRYMEGKGELNNSCMRFKSNQEEVKFYDLFPDKIALAINVHKDKLLSRALIWKLDDGTIYMDRIYAVEPKYKIQMKNYAKEHNMITYDTKGGSSKKRITLTCKKRFDGDDYPYFDTFYEIEMEKKNKKTGEYTYIMGARL